MALATSFFFLSSYKDNHDTSQSSNFGQILPQTAELIALSIWKKVPINIQDK